MTSRPILRITALLLLLFPLAPNAIAEAATPPSIPTTHATTLAGTTVSLPDLANPQPTIVIVSFSQASRAAVTAWERRLVTDFNSASGPSQPPAWYQVAMLASVPRLLRGMVTSQIRSSIPEAVRPHFLALTDNEAAWRAAAHYSAPDDAYVLLLDPAGTIVWQQQGNVTDDAYHQLRQHLAALQPPR